MSRLLTYVNVSIKLTGIPAAGSVGEEGKSLDMHEPLLAIALPIP